MSHFKRVNNIAFIDTIAKKRGNISFVIIKILYFMCEVNKILYKMLCDVSAYHIHKPGAKQYNQCKNV